MTANFVILVLVTLQRLGELWVSRRNTARLLSQGAREHAAAHYSLIVGVHVGWLAALWWLAPAQPIYGFWLALFVVIEVSRIWVLISIGRRWTTRIIVLPDAQLVRRGPYRWINHPNYWVVVAEIAVLPLVFGLWTVALVFSLLNAAVLSFRIRQENRALGRT
jgi:methyltransferase